MSPKISVIIANLNQAEELKKTLQSIQGQTYCNYEVIVIDGGSQDHTYQIAQEFKKIISHYSSEKDKGISDAFNKGILASSGDYIYFLGAGDILACNESFANIMEDNSNEILICGKMGRVSKKGDVLWTTQAKFNKTMLLFKMALPHQGLFTHKVFFKTYGLFSLDCKFAMDYELLLRAYKDFPPVKMKDVLVAYWKEGGIGQNRTLEIFQEYNQIKRKNKIAPSFILTLIHLWTHFKYYVRLSLSYTSSFFL